MAIIVICVLSHPTNMKTYTFIKEDRKWYIDLPEYIEQGGDKGDLQMVDGADVMLDVMSGNTNEVSLIISRDQFEDSDTLQLLEVCDPVIGGGMYLFSEYEGKNISQKMWLCAVTEFVFGDLPEKIFVKKV